MDIRSLVVLYPDNGDSIRTICRGDDVLFCLTDVVRLLASQNSKIIVDGKTEGLYGLVKAQLEVLEKDELFFPTENQQGDERLHYITQAGLFRIVLRDNSPACKKFQKWVLGDVLPSIQKFGTYPPPVNGNSSELKRMVQGLLAEIEQREKLEIETKQRFDRHERMLNELSTRLDSGGSIENDGVNYVSIADFCVANDIDPIHNHYIFGWCLKICAEQAFKSPRKIIHGQVVTTFPDVVINQAWQQLGKSSLD